MEKLDESALIPKARGGPSATTAWASHGPATPAWNLIRSTRTFAAIAAPLLIALSWSSCSSEEAAPPASAAQEANRSRQSAGEAAAEAAKPDAKKASPKLTVEQMRALIGDPLRGRVIAPGGRPMAGARVTLYRRLRQWPRRDRVKVDSVLSGKAGGFSFGSKRVAGLEVEVLGRGCAVATQPVASTEFAFTTVRLRPGFSVHGRVLLPSGRPAARCAVFLEPGSGSQMRTVESRTDSDGFYDFQHVPAGNLRVSARHVDYKPAISDVVAVGASTRLRFSERSIALSGRIHDTESSELPGAIVDVYPRTTNGVLYAPFRTKTDASGHYTIRGLGPGRYNVEVQHDTHSTTLRTVSMQQSRFDFDVELQSRIPLRGRLIGMKVFEPTTLTVISHYGEISTTRVKEDGQFRFPGGVTRGSVSFELGDGPYCFKATRSRWFRRSLVASATNLQFDVQPASVVAGVVKSSRGTPLAGVQVFAAPKVTAMPWSVFNLNLLAPQRRVLAITDKDGCYRIRGLEPGEVNLGFFKSRFAYDQKVVHVLEKLTGKPAAAAVELVKPGVIRGRVTRGTRPVVGALVTVGHGLWPVFTGPGGRFTLRGLPPGEHLVRVKFRTLPVAHSDAPVKLTAGQEASGIHIKLPVGRQVRGRVIDQEEIPIANVVVKCPSGTSAVSDENGRFTMEVPFGKTPLFLMAAGFETSADRVIVEPGQEQIRVQLRLAPRATLRAKILALPKLDPVDGVLVRLDTEAEHLQVNPLQPHQAWVQSMRVLARLQQLSHREQRGDVERWVETPDGVLDVDDLPPGAYTITIQAKGCQPFRKNVVLQNGRPLEFGGIKLERGFRVHGVVVGQDGQPVPGARVVLGRESDLTLPHARVRYLADNAGRFVVEGVGLHLKRLFVSAKGYATQYYEIDLAKDILRTAKNPVSIRMHTGATIKAMLVDTEGEPVPFTRIQINRGLFRIGEAETDHAGVAWFQNLSRGTYHLFVQGRWKTIRRCVVPHTKAGRVYRTKLKMRRRR